MKRTLAIFLSVLLIFVLSGCGSKKNKNNTGTGDELYSKAIAILDELSEDQRVKDFRKAYDLLMTLPSEEDKFISQLGEVNEIYKKYGVELNYGDYYLLPKNTIGIDQKGINEYRYECAYYDANDLLDAVVYPVLFEKYGNEAQSIKGITADRVISAIKSTNYYNLDEKKIQYNSCKETWKYISVPKSKCEIKYHSNGLVESVDVPIVRSDNPLSDDEYVACFEKNTEEQKHIAGSRFMSMSNQFSTLSTGYEVLSQIFTDEEITIISNYIHSLTIEDIWERNLLALTGEPTAYVSAIIVFNYKGNNICIEYGLNDITLNVIGNNIVNPLSHRWYILWCGLCLPEGREKTIENYSDYINNNTTINGIIYDYSFDLDANADKFTEATIINSEQTQGDKNTQSGDVQDSIPVDLSMDEEIFVLGVIERNDSEFPNYRLRLNPKLNVIFTDDDSDKVYNCEYMYFYNEAELNSYFPFDDFVGENCEVTALLEDYRGGGKLFLLNPKIKIN